MTCVAVVQARMGSTRLPGKVLRPLGNASVLAHVLLRTSRVKGIDAVLVATPFTAENDAIVHEARRLGAWPVRGEEGDVLGRYVDAALLTRADRVVRITADCPCIDPAIIDRVIDTHRRTGSDYTSNVHPRSFPKGMDVEVIETKALTTLDSQRLAAWEREHVTPAIWQHPDRFQIANVYASSNHYRPNLRLTLDTFADYVMLQALFDLAKKDDFTLEEALELVHRHPWLEAINSGSASVSPSESAK